ncbi:LysM peptidoglycan-binding domain-containing protein [Marinobacter nanhaiticus D15-8W]|uniref:LysM peptidoglycan-binding domain-containing protein n=1 Tax=Marinobacter nanhaiticus D15-8W TaxID=626887 RepID=N6WT61_9GAMM|nr:LysM peptidoglycan-binding domain-containing protein [Marinobacter nanhaiticus D15-8W]BES71584.1 LysM peptidoglycan-binding domain-containing protein [Marinobacter nanhaiticus D15-8W]
MTMARLISALLFAVLLAGCQAFPGHSEQDGSLSEGELLESERVSIAAGDDELKAAIEGDTPSDDTTVLDDAIEPSLKSQAARARERLEQPTEESVDGDEVAHDLWSRLRSQFAMDLTLDNARIEQQLNWYVKHPQYIDRVAKRARRYLYHIVTEVEARDLPGEFALLPVVESAFDPFAYSHGRAAGLWQFIPSTGRVYDLNQSWWHDQRRDVLSATSGALEYLDALSSRFDGNYLLGLASYNSGAGTVGRAIRRNEARGLPTDYWALDLPRETRAYVPKLIAISKIIQDPEAYGITLPPIPDEPYFEVVDTGSQIDLAQAADLASVDIEEIYLLNPAYNRWATSPEGPHRLLVPVKNAEQFRKGLEGLDPEMRVSWKNYKVRSGDSLIKIARQFGTTPDVIKQVNHMRSNLIRVDQRLLIPTSTKGNNAYALSANERLKDKQAAVGRRADGTRIEHLVQRGDTFWDIARDHNVSVRQLAKWNGMAPGDPLMPGRKLVIWSKDAQTQQLAMASRRGSSDMVRKVGYRVRKGDSLARIANRFNVNVRDIASWNSLDINNYLQPGQSLVLYVDIRRSP